MQKGKSDMPQMEVNGEIMQQCDACGNIWDGNAQCNCWQYNAYAAEEEAPDSAESGYETD